MHKIKFILGLGFISLLFGCLNKKEPIDISTIQLNQKFYRFEQDLFAVPHDSVWEYVPIFEEKYGDYFEVYNQLVIKIGGTNQIDYDDKLVNFITDPYIESAFYDVHKMFNKLDFKDEITNAFKRIKYFYPEKSYPDIYTHISGFNQSIFIDSAFLSISLDKYLGAESKYYGMLRISNYLRQNMHAKKIPSDVVYAYLITEFPLNIENPTLIDHMLYYGKIHCFLEELMPNTADSLRWGIPNEKLLWCKKNERKMWMYLVENKLLFSTQFTDIKKFIDNGPFTSVFSKKSPAKSGQWLGYQIVKGYLKQHPEVTYPQLLNNAEHQQILNQSKYKP